MNINITPEAAKQLKCRGGDYCCVVVRRGGCFGYTAKMLIEKTGDLLQRSEGIDIYYSGDIIEEELLIDYQSSLIKTGFIVRSLVTSNCCCNKSFGRSLNKKNCNSKTT